jgi:hypothetical protein
LLFEQVESQPQAVGVEIRVAVDVLERVEVRIRALRDFAQQQAAIGEAAGEVASFAVGGRAAGHFHQERSA